MASHRAAAEGGIEDDGGGSVRRSTPFRVSGPNIIHEVFKDETVILNFDNGAYYSLVGIAADVWSRIDGATVDDLIERIVAECEVPRRDVEIAVMRFLRQLQEEGLIAPVRVLDEDEADDTRTLTNLDAPTSSRFESLVLRKYTDMEDLFALDPIHDVDEVGWPVKRDSASEPTLPG